MRVAVVGIGGVGGYYGGKLASSFPPGSEHEIVFVCRGPHLDAIRSGGLRLYTRDGELVAHPAIATDRPTDLGVVDVAIFAVKGYSLAEVARTMRPAAGPGTVIIPLGNGVDNDATLGRELITGRVLNGLAYISSHIEAPGVVRQTGGSLKIVFGSPGGETEPYRAIAEIFKSAGIDAELSGHILRDVWTKFIFIDPISGVTSLHGATMGAVLGTDALRQQLVDLMSEVEAIAAGLGVGFPADVVDQAVARVAAFPPDTKTSMQLDVEKGARTEIEALLGYVVRAGRELAIPTPRHLEVYDALKRGAP